LTTIRIRIFFGGYPISGFQKYPYPLTPRKKQENIKLQRNDSYHESLSPHKGTNFQATLEWTFNVLTTEADKKTLEEKNKKEG
jgi:hypothetical protein